MACGIGLTAVRGSRQGFKCRPQSLGMAGVADAADAYQRGDGLLHMLGAGVIALQEALDEGGDHLALDGHALIRAEKLDFGNTIAPGMLRDVHSLIRNANDVFHAESMGRETRDAKAA